MSARPDLTAAVAVDAVDAMRFSARTEAGRPERIFGGQVMAQALAAAARTVPAVRAPYHLHAQFVQSGKPADTIDLEVESTADLGRFTHRRVRATQSARHLLNLSASFQVSEDGPEYQDAVPVTEAPEDVPLISDLVELDGYDAASAAWVQRLLSWIPVEIRSRQLPGRVPSASSRPVPARLSMWMRSHHPIPDEALVHQCGAVYVSDLFLLTTALGQHGLRISDDHVFAVTLDHSMWFHAPIRLDDWVRYDQEAVWTGGGRMLCRGTMFDRNGRLLASTTQGGLLRVREAVNAARSL